VSSNPDYLWNPGWCDGVDLVDLLSTRTPSILDEHHVAPAHPPL